MSGLNFQKVLAHLIRFPNESLEVVEEKLGKPQLSNRERQQLHSLEADPLVRKYGAKMSFCRKRDAMQAFRLSQVAIPQTILDKMFYERFEPARTSTDFVMLGVQFLETILSDEVCQRVLSDCPIYTRDLVKYDWAKAFIVRQVMRDGDPGLPVGSLLKHRAYIVIDLDFDVPKFDVARTKAPGATLEPELKNMKLIFLRSTAPPFYRMFQIDESIERFLDLQSRAPEEWQEPLPKAYEGMAKVGLCRSYR